MLLIFLGLLLLSAVAANAQTDSLEERVGRLERGLNDKSGGAALFLFGAFCALWAQNTGRSAWAWFFLGLFFSVITVIVLLYKNSKDRATAGAPVRAAAS
jgi:hypothetical protein